MEKFDENDVINRCDATSSTRIVDNDYNDNDDTKSIMEETEVDFKYMLDLRAKDDELKRINDELNSKLLLEDDREEEEETNDDDDSKNELSDNSNESSGLKDDESVYNSLTIEDTNDYYGTLKQKKLLCKNMKHKKDLKLGLSNVNKNDGNGINNKDNEEYDSSSTISLETINYNSSIQNDNTTKDVTIRLQRAKIQTLNQQHKQTQQKLKDTQASYSKIKQTLKGERMDKQRIEKQLKEKDAQYQKLLSQNEECQNTLIPNYKEEIKILKRDLVSAQKVVKKSDHDCKNREIRLSRALEECNKYKTIVQNQTKQENKDKLELQQTKGKEILTKKIRLLEKQRNELLNAFQKQMKLIDVVKKQKVHAEASKFLNITEEEFMKVLDWGF